MLDEFKCHVQAQFIRSVNDVGTDVAIIPGGYTCVLQPCDVGINKPLKDQIRTSYTNWAAIQMMGLPPGTNVPVPDRLNIVAWLVDAWNTVTKDTIQATFRKIGFGMNSQLNDVENQNNEIEIDGHDDVIDVPDAPTQGFTL